MKNKEKAEKLLELMGEIDVKYIEEARMESKKQKSVKKTVLTRWTPVIRYASFAAVLVLCFIVLDLTVIHRPKTEESFAAATAETAAAVAEEAVTESIDAEASMESSMEDSVEEEMTEESSTANADSDSVELIAEGSASETKETTAGNAASAAKNQKEEVVDTDEWLEAEILDVDATHMKLRYSGKTDNSAQVITFGNMFDIEMWNGSDWKSILPVDLAWTQEAYIVIGSDALDKAYHWENIYGELKEGKYRLRIDYQLQTGEDSEAETKILYVDFEL